MVPAGQNPNLLNADFRVKYVRNTRAGSSSEPTAKTEAHMLRNTPWTAALPV